MWTPQFIGISVGCFLMIVAIMGGGVEVKEIKIPRLSGWARFGSALLGAAIALASSGIRAPDSQAVVYSPPPAIENASAGTTDQAGAETAEPTQETNSQKAPTEPQLPPAPPQPAGFVTIIDVLGEGQEYERIDVTLNGETVGRLTIDQSDKVDRLRIPADDSVVRYDLEGRERGFQSEGMITHRLEGRGTITLSPGAIFEVKAAGEQADYNDDILQIELQQTAGAPSG
jgi:hypothetical protein